LTPCKYFLLFMKQEVFSRLAIFSDLTNTVSGSTKMALIVVENTKRLEESRIRNKSRRWTRLDQNQCPLPLIIKSIMQEKFRNLQPTNSHIIGLDRFYSKFFTFHHPEILNKYFLSSQMPTGLSQVYQLPVWKQFF